MSLRRSLLNLTRQRTRSLDRKKDASQRSHIAAGLKKLRKGLNRTVRVTHNGKTSTHSLKPKCC